MSRIVDLYPYHIEDSKVSILLFKRSMDVIYAGQWRMIGGKVREDEHAADAAKRELYEESSLSPELFWTIPSVNTFYDSKADRVRQIPAFAASVDPTASIRLNHEHTDWAWVSEEEIEEYIKWPEQRRLIKLLIRITTDNQILEEWII